MALSKSCYMQNVSACDEEKENKILNTNQELSINTPNKNYEMTIVPNKITPIGIDMVKQHLIQLLHANLLVIQILRTRKNQ